MNADDQLLYHYTDATGAKGIVGDGVIFMTDIRHLNDMAELLYAGELLGQVIQPRLDELRSQLTDEVEDGIRSQVSILDRVVTHYVRRIGSGEGYEFNGYVASFCESGDLLSQWRGYAGGALGYALGFDEALLAGTELVGSESDSVDVVAPTLVKIEYGPDNSREILEAIAEELAPQPTGHLGVTAWSQFGQKVMPAIARIKNPAFAEENEWRLLVTTDLDHDLLQFRASRSGLIPFVAGRWPRESLRHVVVGPGPDKQLRVTAMTRFLQAHDLDVLVTASEVPFRV